MQKIVNVTGSVVTVRAQPEDAIARIRRLGASLRARVPRTQPTPLLTDAERDLLLLAVAQKLGIL